MKNSRFKIQNLIKPIALISVFCIGILAQTGEPKPSAPKSGSIPAVKESKLENGLQVAVVESKNVPLVTVQLLVRSGAASEDMSKAGLADMTASLLTKGTAKRSANDIAQQIEFLGGTINTGAGWNNSVAVINVMSDKLDKALEIMSDAVLNPSFKQEEIDLIKSQALDGLTYNLTQPGFLANYVAAKYSFNEHPAGGTPASINSITRDDISAFHEVFYIPSNAILIFTGNITATDAQKLAEKYFGGWKRKGIGRGAGSGTGNGLGNGSTESKNTVNRVLVVDLPNSGQASVTYAKDLEIVGRESKDYYPASVLNSLLGGGYSSRLNLEIRIKRGLSYGAGSGFAWRSSSSNFSTRTQTKNESAAEVAELVIAEINKLSDGAIPDTELGPRKLVLTGGFGRNLETTGGLAGALSDLYSFGISSAELNNYMKSVQAVSDAQIKTFAGKNLKGGDIIIVGDYKIFKDDLAKRFPGMNVQVIEAANLDISKDNLQK
jgi:zinc protease